MPLNKQLVLGINYRNIFLRGAGFPAAIVDPPLIVGLFISSGAPTIWFIAFCPDSAGPPVTCSTATA